MTEQRPRLESAFSEVREALDLLRYSNAQPNLGKAWAGRDARKTLARIKSEVARLSQVADDALQLCDQHLSPEVRKETQLRIIEALATEEGGDLTCSECGRQLHGYRGPRCRYCAGTAE